MSKKSYVEVTEKTAEGWRKLAEQREEEVKDLKERVTNLETDKRADREDYRQLREEHATVIRLNITLQESNSGLQRQITERDEIIRTLRLTLDQRYPVQAAH